MGYHLLSNHSIGPILLPKLKELDWPVGIIVDELNWGPIAIVQAMEAMEKPYHRVVFLVATERPERKIGQINLFQWKGGLPDEPQIQACIGDAATGVISIDNLLVIGEFFKVWPKEVYLIDVEPGPEQAGEHLSPEVIAKVSEVIAIVQRVAEEGIDWVEKVVPLYGESLFSL